MDHAILQGKPFGFPLIKVQQAIEMLLFQLANMGGGGGVCVGEGVDIKLNGSNNILGPTSQWRCSSKHRAAWVEIVRDIFSI